MLKGKTGSNEPVLVQLFNAIGQVIYTATIQPENGVIEHTINIKAAPGVYLLKSGNEVVRVVVE